MYCTVEHRVPSRLVVAVVCNGIDRHAKARIDTQSRREPEAGPRLTRGLVSFSAVGRGVQKHRSSSKKKVGPLEYFHSVILLLLFFTC